MIQIDTHNAIEQVRTNFAHLTRSEQKDAIVRAVNRTAYAARTEMNKSIRAQYKFPATHIRLTSLVVRATKTTLTALIVVKAWPTPLSVFKPRQIGQDVRVNIKRRDVVIKKAMVMAQAQASNDGTGKVTNAKQVKSRGRYTSAGFQPNHTGKLSKLNTLSTAAAAKQPETIAAITQRINDYFPSRLRQEMNFIANRIR